MLRSIIESDIMQIFSYIVGAVGLISSIITIRTNKKCKPTYTSMTKCFIKNIEIKEITIKYLDECITQLSISTLAFWNRGQKTLKKADFLDELPYIRINNDSKILNYVLFTISDENTIKCEHAFEDGRINLDFNNISYNQGFVIDIIHTGSQNNDISVNFKFCDLKTKKIQLMNESKLFIIEKILNSILLFIAIIIIILFEFVVFATWHIGFAIIYLITSSMFIYEAFKKISHYFEPYKNLPKKFRQYFKKINY